jgi:outer membrane lipoprotein carrier protein
MRVWLTVVVFFVALAGLVPAAQAPLSATDLAARIQGRYATVRDFTADFTLVTTSALSLGGGSDRGTVAIKKPVRMRWTLATGSRHVVISDGTTIYNYFPKDKVVSLSALTDQTSTALLLLTGRGDLTRDFAPRLSKDQPAAEWHLTLVPKTAQSDYTELTLAVDRRTLRIVGLDILDDQGTARQFRFSNLRENTGLADSAFTFKIPAGVDVQR